MLMLKSKLNASFSADIKSQVAHDVEGGYDRFLWVRGDASKNADRGLALSKYPGTDKCNGMPSRQRPTSLAPPPHSANACHE